MGKLSCFFNCFWQVSEDQYFYLTRAFAFIILIEIFILIEFLLVEFTLQDLNIQEAPFIFYAKSNLLLQ